MPNRFQKTLRKRVSFEGIGLHTGAKSKLGILPAQENSGIVFERVDLDGTPSIPADVDYVVDTNRGTMLERNGVRIHTVEHILAALMGMGIDNAIIELDGPEPPIMDGSALNFVQMLEKAGTVELNDIQQVFKIIEPFHYKDDESEIEINILPYKNFKITFFMDYGLPDFGMQYASIENVEDDFIKEIAPARTFGLLSEVTMLKNNGLIKGGSLENAIIVADKKVSKKEQEILSKLIGSNKNQIIKNGDFLNRDGLRFANEPVRHKVLDLIGDLSLFGKPVIGHFIATRSGHKTNIELIRKIRQMVIS